MCPRGKLALGFRTGGLTCWEEEYPALVMCNAIFGGTPLSKLFLNVREKLSLCYYASSMLEKMKGLVLVSSGIEFDKYQQARDEILAQLGGHPPGRDRGLGAGGGLPRPDQRPTCPPWTTQGRPEWTCCWGQAAAGLDTVAWRCWRSASASVTREHVGGRRRPEAGAGHRVFSGRGS
ncbi:MAG: insulinase family protein [Oscillospiraceae bacterium]